MQATSHSDEPSFERLPSEAPLHPREVERLASVCGLAVCDRATDPLLDGIAQRAAAACGVRYGLVTLVREFDQVFLGNSGLEGDSTPRDEAICAHTILEDAPFVVDDLLNDPRFAQLPIATQAPFIRFYAGAPVFDSEGLPMGSLCVLDALPREFDSRRLFALQRFAKMASAVLEARRLAVDFLETPPHRASNEAALARLDDVLSPLIELASGSCLKAR